jgi:alkylmercury lyase
MHHPSLETLASHLSEQLRCTQEDLCRQIIYQVARGKPVAPATLQTSLQISQHELEQRLTRLPETEFDQEGNILGWGVTLVPTSHRFQLDGKVLYTWCAFDTVLFPPSLHMQAHVHSTCPVTGQAITFVATPEGEIRDLTPASSVMSLLIPESRLDCVRDIFCQQSLFFQAEQAASTFLATRPEAVLFSLEEAAHLGWLVASGRFTKTNLHQTGERQDAG